MPTGPSDRALRRLVADLSKASTDDIRSVVAELDRPQRAIVEKLLASYGASATALDSAPSDGRSVPRGGGGSARGGLPPRDQATGGVRVGGLSPWLGQRLDAAVEVALGPSRAVQPFFMTELAREALRDSARELLQSGAVAPPPAPQARSVGRRLLEAIFAVKAAP